MKKKVVNEIRRWTRKLRRPEKERNNIPIIINQNNMAVTKVTLTMDDGSTQDFVAPVAPASQVVTLTSGQTLEVIAA